MFRKNVRHCQPPLMSSVSDLPTKQRQRLDESWAGTFYREFFCRIDEEPLRVLYADGPSRPNVPVNVLIALEALKAGFGWSDAEMHDHFSFDVQVRYAVGYHQLGDGEFDLRTVYNFRQRLSRYNQEHGLNLLLTVFRHVTDHQLSALKLQTGTQRMDSSHIASNILQGSRLQLLVEAVQRVDRMLSDDDRAQYAPLLLPYRQGSSGHYVYRVKGADPTEQHLRQIGLVMQRLIVDLAADYAQELPYQVMCRVFSDHFQVEAEQICLRPKEDLQADSLQSVDDLTATFRRKRGQGYKGYVFNVTETCHPENPVQLITEVQVAPNNVDDAALLVEALPDLTHRMALQTLYTDGGYGSPAADAALRTHQVEQVQTALRGSAPDPTKLSLADFAFEQAAVGTPLHITCPQGQRVPIDSGRSTGYVARFAPAVCSTCPFAQTGRCRAAPGKRDPRFSLHFTLQRIRWAIRRRRSRAARQEDHNLRVAVEATVRQIKHPFPAGKLPVRGQFRVTCLVIASAAMANIRRIRHYLWLKRRESRRQVTQNEPRRRQSPRHYLWFSRLWAFGRPLFRPLVLFKTCFGC